MKIAHVCSGEGPPWVCDRCGEIFEADSGSKDGQIYCVFCKQQQEQPPPTERFDAWARVGGSADWQPCSSEIDRVEKIARHILGLTEGA